MAVRRVCGIGLGLERWREVEFGRVRMAMKHFELNDGWMGLINNSV